MKKAFLTTLFIAILALTGCTFKTEDSISTESATQESSADTSTDVSNIESESKESDGNFPSVEKIAPIIPIPSTLSDVVIPTLEAYGDFIAEPLFELDGIAYESDVLNQGYDFITDENGDIFIVTYNVGAEPVEVSEFARSIREDQGWTPPEILNALQELDTLEYIGRAEFIEDVANVLEYHNSYLFRYKDKVLLIEPPSDSDEDGVYNSTMFKPCK